MINFFKKRI